MISLEERRKAADALYETGRTCNPIAQVSKT
jgi:hypothetical protein